MQDLYGITPPSISVQSLIDDDNNVQDMISDME